jgi:hypothetical protein
MRCLCHSAQPVVMASVFKVVGLETCAYNAILTFPRKRAIWIAVMSLERESPGTTGHLGLVRYYFWRLAANSLVVFDIVLCRCSKEV